jgi:hypothetical protein
LDCKSNEGIMKEYTNKGMNITEKKKWKEYIDRMSS